MCSNANVGQTIWKDTVFWGRWSSLAHFPYRTFAYAVPHLHPILGGPCCMLHVNRNWRYISKNAVPGEWEVNSLTHVPVLLMCFIGSDGRKPVALFHSFQSRFTQMAAFCLWELSHTTGSVPRRDWRIHTLSLERPLVDSTACTGSWQPYGVRRPNVGWRFKLLQVC